MPIATEIHQAIQQREFYPYFQPMVELRTGKIEGFEVLARWLHPTRGIVMPDDFIPQVESLGLMNGLSISVLTHAFAAVVSLSDSFGLSVNISPVQLRDASLPELIYRLADDAGFDLKRLTVEITESALVDPIEVASTVVAGLKSFGVRLSLDDFGTGYSSLLNLQSLPFDEIKVDKSFIASMTTQRQSRKIAASVIGLGQNLGLRTVAEGIEEKDQAALLIWHGCNVGQGWLYGHPTQADHLPNLLSQQPLGCLSDGYVSPEVADIALSLDAHPAERLSQLRAIYDAAPVGLAFLDRDLRYVSINQQLADINRRPVHAHLGRTVAEIHPKLFPVWENNLRRALAGEAVLGVELERPSPEPNGPMFYNLASYQPAFDESGEVVGVSISVADITANKLKDAALRESEDHYRHTVELNPQSLWVTDANGHDITVSERWQTITGFSAEQARQFGWLNAVHEDDRQKTMDAWQHSLKTGELLDVEYRVHGPDGTLHWLRSRGAPRRDAEGNIYRWYGSVESIDDHQRVLERLSRSRAMLTAVIEAAPVGIVIAEMPGEIIVSANARAESILGVRLQPGAPWSEASWVALDEFRQPIALHDLPLSRAIRLGQSSAVAKVLVRRADTSEIWTSLNSAPICSEAGDVIGAVLALHDIDAAKQKDEQIFNLATQLKAVVSNDIFTKPVNLA